MNGRLDSGSACCLSVPSDLHSAVKTYILRQLQGIFEGLAADVREDSSLPGCYTILPVLFGLLDPEDEVSLVVRDAGNELSVCTSSHTRRLRVCTVWCGCDLLGIMFGPK
jgi:hypothetical protein